MAPGGAQQGVVRQVLEVDGRPVTVHVGGEGEALLLVHGGWAGAEVHWSKVWGPLAARYRVIAPELPGLGAAGGPGLGSAAAYADWLVRVLAALGASRAWCVGNSFGAGVAWAFATRHAAACRGLVLVNGVPLPPTPPWLLKVGAWGPVRRLLLGAFRGQLFGARVPDRCFARPRELPEALRGVFGHPAPPQLAPLFDALAAGGEGVRTGPAPLLLWGEADRFPTTDVRAARKLHAALPGSRLAVIPGAGHLPQLEAPEAFLAALVPFLEGGGN
jgi:2-hydroxy-6-oxonona-2,4-dienedioate hydrolase